MASPGTPSISNSSACSPASWPEARAKFDARSDRDQELWFRILIQNDENKRDNDRGDRRSQGKGLANPDEGPDVKLDSPHYAEAQALYECKEAAGIANGEEARVACARRASAQAQQ